MEADAAAGAECGEGDRVVLCRQVRGEEERSRRVIVIEVSASGALLTCVTH